MAACSSARSAYIRLSLACSASSSRSCRTSDTDAPPYLLRHLKNVALLTPCVRHRSGTGTPLSASRRMPTIWVSLNLDFRMTAPWTRAVYVQLSIDRGSLRGEFEFDSVFNEQGTYGVAYSRWSIRNTVGQYGGAKHFTP